MSVKIRIKNNRLYLDIIQNRKHCWEALKMTLSEDPTTKKEQMKLAEVCRAKREMQLLTGEWNLEDKIAGKQSILNYMKKQAETKNPKAPFVRAIAYLEQFKYGNAKLLEINSQWVSDWQKFLLEQPNLSQMTASHYSEAVRQALNKAVRERILTSSPALNVKGIPIPETDKPTLTTEEFNRLKNTDLAGELGAEVKRGFLFACFTGLRVSDITSLKWSEIITKPLTKDNACRFWVHKRQTKTKEIVNIPLVQEAFNIIKPRENVMMNPENFVFERLAKSGTHTDKYIKNWAVRAGIEKVISWHTARRSCATFLLEAGVDPFTVQKILGHKKIEMTAVYAKTDRTKSGAVNALQSLLSDESQESNIIKMA